MALELTIVTPEGQAFDGSVEQVVLPGAEGEFGVLEAHERLLAALRIGLVEIRMSGGSRWAAVSEGFADVSGEQVVVLVDHCAMADRIDVPALERELERARYELRELGGSEEDQVRAVEVETEIELGEAKLAASARSG